jgi:hypothetical protein
MENSPALADKSVIESSLSMVGSASAYILLIGSKYGQNPICPEMNPNQLSLTELEFDHAHLATGLNYALV